MSSYKPVIYIFGAIGLLVCVGSIGAIAKGMHEMSKLKMEYADDYGDFGSSSGRMMINLDDSSASGTSMFTDYMNADEDTASYNPYLGTSVLYTTLRDKNIMDDLKLPDDVDPGLRSLLTRADTSLQELYRSNTHLVLKMVALNEERQTILIQDLRNGNIYDTEIDGRGNFVLLGNEIHSLMADPDDRQHPDELVIHQTYTIATNATMRVFLPEGESYTRKVEPTGAVGDIKVNNGKVEMKVYSTKTPARFDTDRKALRTESP